MALRRSVILDQFVKLDYPGWRTALPPAASAASSLRVAVMLVSGSWGSVSLKVQHDAGETGYKDFSPAVALDASTTQALLSAADLAAVGPVLIVQDNDASAGAVVRVRVTEESET